MNGRLMVIVPDRVSDFLEKGEVVDRYYNPGNLFEEVHLVLVNDDRPDPAFLQRLAGTARVYVHNLPGGQGLFVRIVAIVDAFDAMTTKRPYKEPWSVDKAMEYIRESDGHFEPRLADLFLSIRDDIERIRDYWNQHEKDELFTVSLEAIS